MPKNGLFDKLVKSPKSPNAGGSALHLDLYYK